LSQTGWLRLAEIDRWQASSGLRKKERKKDHAKLIKSCHNQADEGLRETERVEGKAKSNRSQPNLAFPLN